MHGEEDGRCGKKIKEMEKEEEKYIRMGGRMIRT